MSEGIWHDRAERVGFSVWNNIEIKHMTEKQVQTAFEDLAKIVGIHYIWGRSQP